MGTFFLSSKTRSGNLRSLQRFMRFALLAVFVCAAGYFCALALSVPVRKNRLVVSLLSKSPERLMTAVSLTDSASALSRLCGYYMLEDMSVFSNAEKLRRLSLENVHVNRAVLIMMLDADAETLRAAREAVGNDEILVDIVNSRIRRPVLVDYRIIR